MKKIFFVFVVISGFLFQKCEYSYSTATIDDVKMCTKVNDNQCASDNPNFRANTPEIFVSCRLKNAPQETQVKFTWYFLGIKKIKIDAVTLSSGNNNGTLNLQSSLTKPTNGWPSGKYEVEISLPGIEKSPVTKKFYIQ
jgi:hypothetical protein